MRGFHLFSAVKNKRVPFVAGLAIALFGLFALSGLVVQKVSAADCDSNAIIYCGFTSPSNFITKVRNNDSQNGHHDLQTVYAAYGLEPASYDKFVTSSRSGKAYKDGRIIVDGQVVGTAGNSIGRESWMQGSGYFTKNIGGTNYYGNVNAKAFATDGLPITVLFNSAGTMVFAVLDSCGNPEGFTPVASNYSCTSLKKTAVAGKANTYSFTTSATQSGNAAITQYVYNFGDGTTATTTSGSAAVTHTYTKGGTYTAKVTIYVHLPGNQNVTASSGGCQTTITVLTPFYQCLQLTGAILDKAKFSYSFTATAKYGNGATLVSADFNYGDGKAQNGVKPTTSTTFTVQHQYAVAGNYDVSAMLHFMANGVAVTAPTCKALVTPTTPPTPECKPGVPVGDLRCSPCPTNPAVSANDTADCVPVTPPTLPNTGAGNTIAVFAVVVVGSFLAYRQLLFRRHKAAFRAAELGVSALPLGQPLDDEAPLSGTPLAPKRKTFRRNRPF